MEDLPALRGERVAGAVLHRLPAVGAAFVLSCAVAAAVLAPLGPWRPWIALPVASVGTALVARRMGGLPASPVPVWSFTLSALAGVGTRCG